MTYNGRIKVSSEKRFIYHDSFNRGHIQLPRMVINCLNLSSMAKIVYGVISGHVFEHGRTSFPSLARIALACNCTKKTVIKYIDELVEKGFIVKERKGNGKTNDYYLVDLDHVDHLRVSEMFWEAFYSVYREVGTKYEELYDAFLDLLEEMEEKWGAFKNIPVNEEIEEKIKNTLREAVRKEDKNMFIPKNRDKEFPDKPATESTEERKLNPIFGGYSQFVLPDDVEKWKNDHFVTYFYEKYLDATGKTHQSARSKHRGMMGRIIKNLNNDKAKVKQYIDAFFEIGYEIPTLEWFCTSGRLAEIEYFIENGKRPSYLEKKVKKRKEKSAKSTNTGMGVEDFLKRIEEAEKNPRKRR